ncbi:hypothetical protein B6U66_01740 [Candidatus Bathyarchaeota archaeon ex4484_135]|nr:MAG: hypothetical protein B6U66_01740 [Candidatus Bathyarchaeota archaeon ex4484_135]
MRELNTGRKSHEGTLSFFDYVILYYLSRRKQARFSEIKSFLAAKFRPLNPNSFKRRLIRRLKTLSKFNYISRGSKGLYKITSEGIKALLEADLPDEPWAARFKLQEFLENEKIFDFYPLLTRVMIIATDDEPLLYLIEHTWSFLRWLESIKEAYFDKQSPYIDPDRRSTPLFKKYWALVDDLEADLMEWESMIFNYELEPDMLKDLAQIIIPRLKLIVMTLRDLRAIYYFLILRPREEEVWEEYADLFRKTVFSLRETLEGLTQDLRSYLYRLKNERWNDIHEAWLRRFQGRWYGFQVMMRPKKFPDDFLRISKSQLS